VSRARRQLGLLSVSFFSASGLGLLLLVVVARWLTPTENLHFQAVWALIFTFASVLGSVEQEVTRQSTTAALDGRRTPMGAVQAVGLAAFACLVVLAVFLATPSGREVVHGSVAVLLLTLVSVVNFAMLILARGVLLGAHALRGYSALLVGEALARVVLIAVLVLSGVDAAVEWAVLATVVGSLVWVAVLGRLAHAVDWSGGRTPWRAVAGTVTALGTANGLSAMVLTGFPAVVVAILGKSPDLAVLIAVITLSRAPLALMAPVQALTVPTVVRWSRSGDTRHLTRALEYIAGGSAATALVGAAVGYAVGPWAVALVLGGDYRPTALTAALVAAATCVMAGALLQAAALVALQRYWTVTLCWAAAIAGAALVMLAAPWTDEHRGLGGFTLASLVAFVATAIAVRSSVAPAGSGDPAPAH
jgi:O-antigen/teichoic acid export membrane protein